VLPSAVTECSEIPSLA